MIPPTAPDPIEQRYQVGVERRRATRGAREAERRMDFIVVGRFLETGRVGADQAVYATELYRSFQTWCATRGLPSLSQQRFGQCMTEHGFRRQRLGAGPEQRFAYFGLTIPGATEITAVPRPGLESRELEAFIQEQCVETESVSVDGAVLYARFSAWCRDHGHAPASRTLLGHRLGKLGFRRVRRGPKGEQRWYWAGLTLKPRAPASPAEPQPPTATQT